MMFKKLQEERIVDLVKFDGSLQSIQAMAKLFGLNLPDDHRKINVRYLDDHGHSLNIRFDDFKGFIVTLNYSGVVDCLHYGDHIGVEGGCLRLISDKDIEKEWVELSIDGRNKLNVEIWRNQRDFMMTELVNLKGKNMRDDNRKLLVKGIEHLNGLIWDWNRGE